MFYGLVDTRMECDECVSGDRYCACPCYIISKVMEERDSAHHASASILVSNLFIIDRYPILTARVTLLFSFCITDFRVYRIFKLPEHP